MTSLSVEECTAMVGRIQEGQADASRLLKLLGHIEGSNKGKHLKARLPRAAPLPARCKLPLPPASRVPAEPAARPSRSTSPTPA